MSEYKFAGVNNLGCHIAEAARNNPDRPALWVNEQIYSYTDLMAQAGHLAGVMQAFSSDKGNVAIYSYRSAWSYISMLATLLAGKTYVPLTPKFPVERNRKITALADATIICIDKRCEKQAQEWVPTLPANTLVLLPEHDAVPQWCRQNPDHTYLCAPDINGRPSSWSQPAALSETDHAYLLFTSGTTGEPKGIAVSHGNILAYLRHFQQNWPVSPNDRCTQIYEQTFDVSVHDIFTCWQAGACLYVIPETAQLCPVDFTQKHELTRWGSVPSLLTFIKRFGRMKPDSLPSVRFSVFSGEPLSGDMARAWAEVCPNSRIFNMYGPTEGTIHFTAFEWDRAGSEGPDLPIGQPYPNQEVAIVGDDGHLVSRGESGELLLAGNQITQGYWNDTERTDEQFISCAFPGKSARRWYRTGDIVSERADHQLLIHGRKDFQVKVNGYRIELDEIAGTLRKTVPCVWAVAVPWPVDETTGHATGVVAWLSGDNSGKFTENDIKRLCSEDLPPYMVPSRVYWCEDLPCNASGKIDVRRLQQMTTDVQSKKPHAVI